MSEMLTRTVLIRLSYQANWENVLVWIDYLTNRFHVSVRLFKKYIACSRASVQ